MPLRRRLQLRKQHVSLLRRRLPLRLRPPASQQKRRLPLRLRPLALQLKRRPLLKLLPRLRDLLQSKKQLVSRKRDSQERFLELKTIRRRFRLSKSLSLLRLSTLRLKCSPRASLKRRVPMLRPLLPRPLRLLLRSLMPPSRRLPSRSRLRLVLMLKLQRPPPRW